MSRLYWIVAPALLLTLGLVTPAVAQDKLFEETVNLEAGGTLSLRATKGSVRLTSWDQAAVEIRARIEPPRRADADYARRAVEATTVDVESDGRSVRIRSNYEDVPYRGTFGNRDVPFIHYEISAPRQLELDLDIDRSDTNLSGFDGSIVAEFDRSELEASDLAGEIALVLDRGDHVTLTGVRGSIDLEVDRTDVTLREVRIDADSRVEIDRGDLNLELAETQALTLEAEMSRRADFSSDLPVTMQELGRNFRGTINGGGPELRIHADRAEIRIR